MRYEKLASSLFKTTPLKPVPSLSILLQLFPFFSSLLPNLTHRLLQYARGVCACLSVGLTVISQIITTSLNRDRPKSNRHSIVVHSANNYNTSLRQPPEHAIARCSRSRACHHGV